MKRGLLVAHALGGIDGAQYTNSLEAFRCNYGRGYRWFEVDLALTKSGELVCFHPDNEHLAGFDKKIEDVTSAEVARAKYMNRYAIPTFRALLDEAEKLGDVVLVTDTKVWSAAMLAAIRQVFSELPSGRSTKIVLQSYGEKDIEPVKQLSRELGGEVILTLYMSGADDRTVEMLARKYDVIGVVADSKRFSPWLASLLHSANTPLIVHTINDHREIMKLTAAGADGFYTDSYRPYGAALENGEHASECATAGERSDAQGEWLRRDVTTPGAFVLKPCARRTGSTVQLAGCSDQAAIEGPSLSVPPDRRVRLKLGVKGDTRRRTSFWYEVAEKNRSKRLHSREVVPLSAGEVLSIEREIGLPQGSPGVDVRLGLSDLNGALTVEMLRLEHGPLPNEQTVVRSESYPEDQDSSPAPRPATPDRRH